MRSITDILLQRALDESRRGFIGAETRRLGFSTSNYGDDEDESSIDPEGETRPIKYRGRDDHNRSFVDRSSIQRFLNKSSDPVRSRAYGGGSQSSSDAGSDATAMSIARARAQSRRGKKLPSSRRQVTAVGTPVSMAPEQWHGDPDEVDVGPVAHPELKKHGLKPFLRTPVVKKQSIDPMKRGPSVLGRREWTPQERLAKEHDRAKLLATGVGRKMYTCRTADGRTYTSTMPCSDKMGHLQVGETGPLARTQRAMGSRRT